MTAEEYVKQKYPSAKVEGFLLNYKWVYYVKMASAKEPICTASTAYKAWVKARNIINKEGNL